MTARDGGFTLIELLAAIAILGVITVPLANVVLVYLRTSDQTVARLTESSDAQLAAAYFARDVASIGVRAPTSPYPLQSSIDTSGSAAWPYPCSTLGTIPLVRLVWDDYPGGAATATQVRVAYVVSTDGTQLRRLMCSGSDVPRSTVLLARSLDPGTSAAVSCSPACSGTPDTVTVRLTFKAATSRTGPYPVTLTGQRRQT
ncbi:MAG TPA: prepilin-type N-terminal cleavage/methylation domain-containing protein [Amycolatopsis sp.]|nr:prepilin-type N-terminal cleavage/methylation domain-containing protein [Amycolatopsis sp.]